MELKNVLRTCSLHHLLLVMGFLVYCINIRLVTGGFGSYIIAMDQRTYQLIGADYPGNRAEDVKNPSLGWMIGFLFVVSFLGLFSLVPLRKVIYEKMSCCYIVVNKTTYNVHVQKIAPTSKQISVVRLDSSIHDCPFLFN